MAERAYKRVAAKGFSAYAWWRLLEIYATANNVRAALICVSEVLDYFAETLGLDDYVALPPWIEEPLFKLVAKNGLKEIKRAAQTEKVKKYPIVGETFDRMVRDKVCGYDV